MLCHKSFIYHSLTPMLLHLSLCLVILHAHWIYHDVMSYIIYLSHSHVIQHAHWLDVHSSITLPCHTSFIYYTLLSYFVHTVDIPWCRVIHRSSISDTLCHVILHTHWIYHDGMSYRYIIHISHSHGHKACTLTGCALLYCHISFIYHTAMSYIIHLSLCHVILHAHWIYHDVMSYIIHLSHSHVIQHAHWLDVHSSITLPCHTSLIYHTFSSYCVHTGYTMMSSHTSFTYHTALV
jgi:hypothetical protein